MTDVLLRQTDDDGDIEFVNGQAVMSNGLETAAYLSLFGGNDDDSGGDDTKHLQYWGNLSERDPAKQYRSETQYLLRSIPLVPSNLRRIQDAANRDLAWMTSTGLASAVLVAVSMPALNTVKLDVSIEVDGKLFSLSLTETASGD
jgi:phage gp46-like protein